MFFVVGPTGVGKTEIACAIADRCNGEIIGADAFQIYAGMPILTAAPTTSLRTRVPHHLFEIVPPSRNFDVAKYLELAGITAREIAGRGRLPVVAGGTGLYVRALTHGLSDLPEASPALRAELEQQSLEQLQRRLKELDPVCAAEIDLKNPRRLIRAIEVCELTGKPFSSFRDEWKKPRVLACGVFLIRDRAELHARIDRRVVEMMRAGLLDEVRHLGECGPTAAQAIGRKEARACLDGTITPDECVAQIQRATRNYAKHQITWFKREPAFEQVNLSGFHDEREAIEQIVKMAETFFWTSKAASDQGKRR